MSRALWGGVLVLGLAVAAGPSDAARQTAGILPNAVPRILPGAIEVGIGGSMVAVEGSASGSVGLRAGTFRIVRGDLTGFEAEASYRHAASLDVLDLEGALSWQRPLGRSAAYVFLAPAGGVRQEWIGSFRQARYPAGFNFGLRVLAGPRGAARIEYRYRRILRDPVADYTEHQLEVGLSLFFRNHARLGRRRR